jgi:hypothetical protein
MIAYTSGDGGVDSDTGSESRIGIRPRKGGRCDRCLAGLDFQSVTAQGGKLAGALKIVVDTVGIGDVRVAPPPPVELNVVSPSQLLPSAASVAFTLKIAAEGVVPLMVR